ncbi:hypothetical protein AAFF_G00394760 [Aldrovandia affinis]|uniref:Uncharacterized protein n=1 Tax=Aldrovandia affinis TaxID=143900 RepID=A0AAD7WKY6_9TELE|nr:hypothetical protein AAFF_G00394760 [Aldrovandia affinis]
MTSHLDSWLFLVSFPQSYKMSAKRKSMTSPGGSAKKQRKAIDLEMKMKIINDYEAESYTQDPYPYKAFNFLAVISLTRALYSS